MRPLDGTQESVSAHHHPRGAVQLSVIVPVKDEEARLPAFAPALLSFVRERGSAELLFCVDPGSSDATMAMATELGSGSRWIRCVPARQTGKGNALLAGVLAARGDVVLMTDSDLSVHPDQFDDVIRAVRPGTFVIADRRVAGAHRIDDPPLRATMGRIFNVLVRALVLPGLRDTQCGCKAMTASDARRVLSQVTTGGWAFDVEMLARARREGMHISQHPVMWTYRPGSRLTTRGAVRAVLDVLRLAITVGRASDRADRTRP